MIVLFLKRKLVLCSNNFCIAKSFNTNFSHQLLDYTITFANSKGDFVLKNRFRMFILKISGVQKEIRFDITNSINKH